MFIFKDRNIYWKRILLVQSDPFFYNVVSKESFCKSIQYEDFLENSPQCIMKLIHINGFMLVLLPHAVLFKRDA